MIEGYIISGVIFAIWHVYCVRDTLPPVDFADWIGFAVVLLIAFIAWPWFLFHDIKNYFTGSDQ